MSDQEKSAEPTDPTVRIAMSVSPIDADRLKRAAADARTPAAVLSRTLVMWGLDNLTSNEDLADAVEEAAEAERQRRSAAGRRGGQIGGGTNRQRAQQKARQKE
ncbi:hypothetical protein [Gordonia alkaliphila]|uniref:CopG family transcriptional regulator n=1 Tax=Gordonia alkaliphila TaxID=1053547 RepID=A0ABP8Z4L7_9ACTN